MYIGLDYRVPVLHGFAAACALSLEFQSPVNSLTAHDQQGLNGWKHGGKAARCVSANLCQKRTSLDVLQGSEPQIFIRKTCSASMQASTRPPPHPNPNKP